MDFAVFDKGVCRFGSFLLDPARRRLTRDGEPIKLPAKQFDTLLYFLQNPNRVIDKDELLAAIWPGRIVEESSLTQNIFMLRRALQSDETERYIVTAPGRGYRFVAEIVRQSDDARELTTSDESLGKFAAAGTPTDKAAAPARKSEWSYGVSRHFAAVGAVIFLALVALLILALRHQAAPPDQLAFNPPPHSVAVLAFTNMSGDPAQEYFSDGLSEELINTLSRIGDLQVAARMSAFTFKGSSATIGDVGRKLNVGAVLEGSVRSDGTRIRVTARLVNAVTGYQFWSHTYDRDKGDLLQLETEIAEAVARSLEVTLLGAEKINLVTGGTNNPLALDAYLHGDNLIRTFDEPSVRGALAAFDEAIRLDPNFADAHAGRAFALWGMGLVWPDDPTPWETEQTEALAEANRAIALAPQSARGHAVRAVILEWHLDLREADAEAVHAHALESSDIMVERIYARIEAQSGHFREADAAARHLIALDPLTPAQYYQMAGIMNSIGKYDEALIALRREQAIGTVAASRTHEMTADAHLGQGNYRAVLEDCAGPCGDGRLALLAVANMKLGRATEAKAALAKMGDGSAFMNAGVYAMWGDPDTAFHWLDIAVARRDAALIYMRTHGMLDPIRNMPRFLALEQKLGFPERTE